MMMPRFLSHMLYSNNNIWRVKWLQHKPRRMTSELCVAHSVRFQ